MPVRQTRWLRRAVDFDPSSGNVSARRIAERRRSNGAIGAELLAVSGVPRADAPKMLGPLLRSVAENVEALGFPDALTGPVRRE